MHHSEDEDKPCKACSDFKTWAKMSKKNIDNDLVDDKVPDRSKECPLSKDELGRSTWGFLHSLVAYFPDKPTEQQACEMSEFFEIVSKFYPCEPCALDFQKDIEKNPVQSSSRNELAQWLCERHNTVNKKLGKPIFDCSKVHERWKDGWKDGSCD